MRIIAGTYRGRTLRTVRDLSIRPTTDRAKQTIFDILGNRLAFEGARVLDLFAGSGSLGLEALSRGADHATFVEKSPHSLRVLEANVRTLGCQERCALHHADVLWYLKHAKESFNLIFIDPPYALEWIGEIPGLVHRSTLWKTDCYVVMEHSKESAIALTEDEFEVTRKVFGQTIVLILKPIPTPASHRPPVGTRS